MVFYSRSNPLVLVYDPVMSTCRTLKITLLLNEMSELWDGYVILCENLIKGYWPIGELVDKLPLVRDMVNEELAQAGWILARGHDPHVGCSLRLLTGINAV